MFGTLTGLFTTHLEYYVYPREFTQIEKKQEKECVKPNLSPGLSNIIESWGKTLFLMFLAHSITYSRIVKNL